MIAVHTPLKRALRTNQAMLPMMTILVVASANTVASKEPVR